MGIGPGTGFSGFVQGAQEGYNYVGDQEQKRMQREAYQAHLDELNRQNAANQGAYNKSASMARATGAEVPQMRQHQSISHAIADPVIAKFKSWFGSQQDAHAPATPSAQGPAGPTVNPQPSPSPAQSAPGPESSAPGQGGQLGVGSSQTQPDNSWQLDEQGQFQGYGGPRADGGAIGRKTGVTPLSGIKPRPQKRPRNTEANPSLPGGTDQGGPMFDDGGPVKGPVPQANPAYGTHKVIIGGRQLDVSADPDVEARGKAALQRLDTQEPTGIPARQYAKITAQKGAPAQKLADGGKPAGLETADAAPSSEAIPAAADAGRGAGVAAAKQQGIPARGGPQPLQTPNFEQILQQKGGQLASASPADLNAAFRPQDLASLYDVANRAGHPAAQRLKAALQQNPAMMEQPGEDTGPRGRSQIYANAAVGGLQENSDQARAQDQATAADQAQQQRVGVLRAPGGDASQLQDQRATGQRLPVPSGPGTSKGNAPAGAGGGEQAAPQGPAIDFSKVHVDHSQIPNVSSKDWDQLKALSVHQLVAKGMDITHAQVSVDDSISDYQHRQFLQMMQQGISLDRAGNKQGAMAAIRTAYQYMPTGHDVRLGLAPNGTIIGFGVDEQTGKLVGQPVRLDQERLNGLLATYQDPKNFLQELEGYEGMRIRKQTFNAITMPGAAAQRRLEQAKTGYFENLNPTREDVANIRAGAMRGRMSPQTEPIYRNTIEKIMDPRDQGEALSTAAAAERQYGSDANTARDIAGRLEQLYSYPPGPAREQARRSLGLPQPVQGGGDQGRDYAALYGQPEANYTQGTGIPGRP